MLILLLFGINSLLITYIFSFINKSRSTVITILSITPSGIGKKKKTNIHKFDNIKIILTQLHNLTQLQV